MIKRLLPRFLKAGIARFLEARSLQVSQAGQDFWVFGEAFNEKRNGYFVDVGAHDGIHLSNTFLLERRYGWRGVCVEADPSSFALLRRNRGVACIHACLDSQEGSVSFVKRGDWSGIVLDDMKARVEADPGADVIQVRTRTLESLLDEQRAPADPDYLSVDIEGAEERVLAGFNLGRYRFKCITIERPSEVLRGVLHGHGYVLVREVPGLDAFYVRRDFLSEYTANLFTFYMKRRLALRWR